MVKQCVSQILHKTNESGTRSNAANLCTTNIDFWAFRLLAFEDVDILLPDDHEDTWEYTNASGWCWVLLDVSMMWILIY